MFEIKKAVSTFMSKLENNENPSFEQQIKNLLKVRKGGLSDITKQKNIFKRIGKKDIIAFDLGRFSTKVVVFKRHNNELKIKKILTIENEYDMTNLEPSNFTHWKEKIKTNLEKNGILLKKQFAMCSLSRKDYIGRVIDIPFIEGEDLDGLVSFEMCKLLSLDNDKYLFQYDVKKRYTKDDKEMCVVFAVAVAKSICEIYYNLFSELGMRPLLLDIDIKGLERAVTEDDVIHEVAKDKAIAFIDFGSLDTGIAIFNKGNLVQAQRISGGGDDLTVAVKNYLGEEVVDRKNPSKIIIAPQQVHDIIHDPNGAELKQEFENWISEINSYIKRYNLYRPNEEVKHIYVVGGNPQIIWIKLYLEKYLQVPVQTIDFFANLQNQTVLEKEQINIATYANVLGLLLVK